MGNILEKIDNPKDLKILNIKAKEELAKEIREDLLKVVSKTGGHLASNLGIVELTIALHSVFDMPKDKIIWDVGHQTYVHKMLTGRKEKMDTLRQLDGIAGFPKTKESEYDSFNTGHSSTSISVALGMARARDIKKENKHVVAVIGDGALTGGMALEALNDAGNSKTRLIVVLNDNEMSISKNVGGISEFLTKIRTKKFYKKSNNFVRRALEKVPVVGQGIIRLARKVKYSLKQLFLPNMFFEDLGFKYLGPVDGHDIERIEWVLKLAKKEQEQPVLVHIITKKGKGYKPAEENPDKFHATSSFDIETGKSIKEKKKDYSAVFGEKLVKLAKDNNKIVAITAAMADGTGLKNFKEQYPKRFFDVGIAEQHALGLAAGLAKEGLRPVVPIYSSFYQRAYDQVIHDICLQNLPVVMCVDRAGIVGNDGETHQGIFDLSFFNIVPNLSIMAPKDFKELEDMLEYALTLNSPVVIRYPRGGENEKIKFDKHEKIELGKAEIIKEGKDISIIAIGKMVAKGEKLAEEFEKQGKEVEIINARFLKPFDTEKILETIQKTKNVITMEDNTIIGGLATKVKELIAENGLQNIKLKCYAYPDKFIEHGSVEELEKKYIPLETVTNRESIYFRKIEVGASISHQKTINCKGMIMDKIVENKYKSEKDKLLISKITDKIKFCETKNKIQTTDFLDQMEQKLIENFLKKQKITNYFYTGGFEEAERKILIIYPEKLKDIISNVNLNEYINAIRIILPNELKGEYSHRNYLGGLMKLGIAREKVGDILVDDNGADILIMPEMLKFLLTNIPGLTRFSKSKIEKINLENLRKIEIKTEIIKVTVSSMRLDNIVAELAKCSRGKANEILEQERVLVNYETIQKSSKEIKEHDVITIRGKGRFVIKSIVGNTRKGRLFLEVEKFA